jgi:glucose dehydrogenase
MNLRTIALPFVLLALAAGLDAQVPWERLLKTDQEPQNWLTYSGGINGWRHSRLKEITPANAKDLEMKWVFQADSTEKLEASPIVVDGVMYFTQPPNDIVALDARTGRIFWIYQYRVAPDARVRSSWAPSTRTSSPSMRRTAVCSGIRRSAPRLRGTLSRWRRSS